MLDLACQTRGDATTAPSAGADPDRQAAGAATHRHACGQPGPAAESRPASAGGRHDMPQDAGDLSGRYSRQIALFGEARQQRLRDASVVLIGLGGLGSLLAQQLACLGVRRYTLLDGETVSHQDLNRLIGATGADVGSLKAHVAARLIRAIQPAADVRLVTEPVPLGLLGAGAAVGSATAVIAALDNDEDAMRFILTELCSIPGVPYIDAASGVSRAGGDVAYGGRVVVAGPAAGCLFCRGELDWPEARKTTDLRERQAAARGGGASLVTVSSVVASLAATELACLISGLRPPCGMLTYRAHEGIVTRSGDQPARHCLYCDRWAASSRQRVRMTGKPAGQNQHSIR